MCCCCYSLNCYCVDSFLIGFLFSFFFLCGGDNCGGDDFLTQSWYVNDQGITMLRDARSTQCDHHHHHRACVAGRGGTGRAFFLRVFAALSSFRAYAYKHHFSHYCTQFFPITSMQSGGTHGRGEGGGVGLLT